MSDMDRKSLSNIRFPVLQTLSKPIDLKIQNKGLKTIEARIKSTLNNAKIVAIMLEESKSPIVKSIGTVIISAAGIMDIISIKNPRNIKNGTRKNLRIGLIFVWSPIRPKVIAIKKGVITSGNSSIPIPSIKAAKNPNIIGVCDDFAIDRIISAPIRIKTKFSGWSIKYLIDKKNPVIIKFKHAFNAINKIKTNKFKIVFVN